MNLGRQKVPMRIMNLKLQMGEGKRWMNLMMQRLKKMMWKVAQGRSMNRARAKRAAQQSGKLVVITGTDKEVSPNNGVASKSIDDSGIQNCNRSLKRKVQQKLAKDIWEIAKRLGVTTELDEEVIRRIDDMERRDSQAKAYMAKQEAGGVKKVCIDSNDNGII
ncbi:hypothetical protein SLEP1_g32227 [Rubroshorea leprosula]|uniref:Uncharacterized protein n=1 Tax=Rubroshorea leprosula TaxID=152421 RepID=A0AAV5KCL3_9ROSI|nr:hypothetical protein SLEP1_g32227 [Rubroshorea leprosula]